MKRRKILRLYSENVVVRSFYRTYVCAKIFFRNIRYMIGHFAGFHFARFVFGVYFGAVDAMNFAKSRVKLPDAEDLEFAKSRIKVPGKKRYIVVRRGINTRK